jgi:tellurite resistance protein
MPRKALELARSDRNAALIDAMILAGSADGTMSPKEMESLIQRVIERPEFEGTDAAELQRLVERSARRLSGSRGLEEIFSSLRARLPDHRNRLLAFGLATAVALADRKATRAELGLLKGVQSALGISEDEVTRVFEVVESGASLAEALGEPLERLYAETMVLVGAADGVVNARELKVMLENMAGDPVFADVSLELAERYLTDAVQALALEGLPTRLTVLAHGLSTHAQREKAFRLAVRIAYADGVPSVPEQKLLDLLQATLGLADDEVARITVESFS